MALQRSGQSAAMMLAVRAPQSKPAMIALLDPERVHQGDYVHREHRLLAVAGRVARQKARRAVAAQIRHDHAIAPAASRAHIDVAMNVVWPAVQKDRPRTVCRAGFRVSDVQHAGVDLLQRGEGFAA